MTPHDLTLTDYDAPYLAEPIRFIFSYGKIAFHDDRISFNDFPIKKPALGLPFGHIPILRVNGTTYAQSGAIAR
ncbi:hypothetical protein As57867_004825, partial [Aphanomyces stellatus]